MTTTLDFESLIDADSLGIAIGNQYREWDNLRRSWVEQTKELRNYVFATDTTTTGNAILPWSNTTTIPKLTQIKDNLEANYFATLFPSQNWMRWEPADAPSASKQKRDVIQNYMENKVRQSNFVNTSHQLLSDWVLFGNCFATVEWVDNYKFAEDGAFIPQYTGPMLTRISPYDIVFNPASSSFKSSPKIVRSIKTMGEIKRMVEQTPEDSHYRKVLDKMTLARAGVRSHEGHIDKADGFVADGFSNIQLYYNSDNVEVLTFYGDIYDEDTGEFQSDRIITVIDRAYVLTNEGNPSWLGEAPVFHSSWRTRPDNLYGMGPLDNLVGMQYRIDHLENLKADVFDQIAYPVMKIRGDVEDFDFEPGARIYLGEEGDVGYLQPDPTALQADLQIRELEFKMEEMAGAPKQAMGMRTPGEKTAFEVQSLQNSASRIFEHKTAHFERTFLEPILNAMLEMARRNMNFIDTIRVLDDASGVALFKEITKEDITAKGQIRPVGARHFAERARRIQNLTQLFQIKAGDPTVAPHLSGKEIARILAHELGEGSLFGDNISVEEQLETQQAMQEAEALNQEQLMAAAEEGL